MAERLGGHLVAESLAALGARTAFGVPGVHALAIWEGLRASTIDAVAARTELCAGFEAEGYARAGGTPAPLILSTGPGALNSLSAVMEAACAHVPMVAISSQIPSDLIGRGRGYLHELPDQLASFAPLVKHAARAGSVESIPALLARAWQVALTPPSGPTYLEIPVDLLRAPAGIGEVSTLEAVVERQCAPLAQVELAAAALAHSHRPVIWAGGGVLRSGAQHELLELAQLLDAPVATTFMGKGALADDHPLAAGAGCHEAALARLLSEADVLLCVGSELGERTTSDWRLPLPGRLIQLDAAPERIAANYPALPLVGDAKLTLLALAAELSGHRPRVHAGGAQRAADVRGRIDEGLRDQGREAERGLLAAIESALAPNAIVAFDVTILGDWAAPHMLLKADQCFLYPLGSGTLGYALPAAIGARMAHPDREALAVVGDGGLSYAIAELGTAAQHGIPIKLLVIDDGGYGIPPERQRDQFSDTTAVQLPGVDVEALVGAFGGPVRGSGPDDLEATLSWALAQPGPAAVVVHMRLVAPQPTA